MKKPDNSEAEAALAFAREFILRLHRSGDFGSPFEVTESRAFVRRWMRVALLTPQTCMALIDLAIVGEEDARAVLAEVILNARRRNEPLPLEIVGYEMKVIAGAIMPPLRPVGPDKRNEFTRNICICMVVSAVANCFGLKPTGSSARWRSACPIVAEALSVINMTLGSAAVENIWQRYGHAMPAFSTMGPFP